MPPKPASVEAQLEGKSLEERASIKAHALADSAPGNKRLTFTQDGITCTVAGWYVDADDALCVTITASDVNGAVPTDNLYRFVNPPIKVPDGAGGFTENLLGAARQIFVDAVRVYAVEQGWTP